jgi:hypothetical protein
MHHSFTLHGICKDCNPHGWQGFAVQLCRYLTSKSCRIRYLPKWKPRTGYFIYIVDFISKAKEVLLRQLDFHFLLGEQNVVVGM